MITAASTSPRRMARLAHYFVTPIMTDGGAVPELGRARGPGYLSRVLAFDWKIVVKQYGGGGFIEAVRHACSMCLTVPSGHARSTAYDRRHFQEVDAECRNCRPSRCSSFGGRRG
jgi:hypothetical protein